MTDKIKASLKLSAPWYTFAREVYAMFIDDPDIKYVFDEDELTIKLYVEDADKADALSQILPTEKAFGNVVVKIQVIPANKLTGKVSDLFQAAFKNNPAFVEAQTIEGVFTNPLTYVVFKNKVVQYWNDDLSDLNGMCSTLYEDIAADIFEIGGVNYCTELGDVTPIEPTTKLV